MEIHVVNCAINHSASREFVVTMVINVVISDKGVIVVARYRHYTDWATVINCA